MAVMINEMEMTVGGQTPGDPPAPAGPLEPRDPAELQMALERRQQRQDRLRAH